MIDKGRTFDGLVFLTNLHRILYIRTLVRDRPEWLKKNVGVWRRIEDVLQEAAPPGPPVESEIDLGAEPAGPNDQTSSRGVQDNRDDEEGVALVDTLAGDRSPPRVPTPPTPVTATVTSGTTKAEVLSRTKAAIEAGESLRDTARRLAFAQEDFHASQREIAEAIGRSASWVNRLLKWRRSGYKECNAFGPTTRAGRAAHAQQRTKISKPRQPEETTTTISADVETPSSSSLPTPVTVTVTNRSTKAGLLPPAKAAMSEAEGPKTETTPLGAMGRKRGRSGGRQIKKQKLPAEAAKAGRMLSPERMRFILDSLTECPILSHAARKAGIHPKTLAYWIKGSAAGDAGYDVEWRGETWKFHELCEAAIDEAHDKILEAAQLIAMGGVIYKTDQSLVDLGCEGPDAYLRDENGNPVVETIRKPNGKMIRFLLELLRPEKWGKHRKIDVPQKGGVLVIGAPTEKPKNNSAASIKARQWKSRSRMIREAKRWSDDGAIILAARPIASLLSRFMKCRKACLHR